MPLLGWELWLIWGLRIDSPPSLLHEHTETISRSQHMCPYFPAFTCSSSIMCMNVSYHMDSLQRFTQTH